MTADPTPDAQAVRARPLIDLLAVGAVVCLALLAARVDGSITVRKAAQGFDAERFLEAFPDCTPHSCTGIVCANDRPQRIFPDGSITFCQPPDIRRRRAFGASDR